MPATYEPIATQTLGSAAASVTFSSIPSTYTDLVIISAAKITSGSGIDMVMRFNGDSGTNYSAVVLFGTGATVSSTYLVNNTNMYCDYYGALDSAVYNTCIINIQNYSNSTTYKTTLIRSNNANIGLDAISGSWRSTAAINSVLLFPTASTFTTGSTFSLYGIKAA
jgi:hypothetical protein